MTRTIATLALALTVLAAASSTTAASPPVYPAPKRIDLALGDSIAFGFQFRRFSPGVPASVFDTGYADVLAARLRAIRPNLTLVNLACVGESTSTFLAGPCPYRALGHQLHVDYAGSQLTAALEIMRAHPHDVSPVTLTLAGNDINDFVASCHGDPSCIRLNAPAAIAAFTERLRTIIERLRAVDPRANVILTGVYNPNLTGFADTDPLFTALDNAMTGAANTEGARVARLFPTFDPDSDRLATLCNLTLACSDGDTHPSDGGYKAIADLVFNAGGYDRLEADSEAD